MPIVVRAMHPGDVPAFFPIHSRSVRVLAAGHYSPDGMEAWSGPLTEEGFLANPHGEIRLIADLDGRAVGFGALVLSPPELRACYVMPDVARKGVGTALVREIERIAMEQFAT